MLTNSSQAAIAGYSYGPYGASAVAGTGGSAFGYTGAEFNGADQLLYLGNRYYSPQQQRFISEDPIGLAGGTNIYAYVDGDPVDFLDPEGLLAGVPAGESYGEEAAQYWADLAVKTGNPLYNIPGAVASLWTPCTSDATASTLIGAYGLRVFGPFTTRGVPRFLARYRQYIRYDAPHHNKGWEFDGRIPNWVRNRFK